MALEWRSAFILLAVIACANVVRADNVEDEQCDTSSGYPCKRMVTVLPSPPANQPARDCMCLTQCLAAPCPMIQCPCSTTTVYPLIVPAHTLTPNVTVVTPNVTANVTVPPPVNKTEPAPPPPPPQPEKSVVLGPMCVDTGDQPTEQQLTDAFNLAKGFGPELEAALKQAAGNITTAEIVDVEKVLVKGMAKVVASLSKNYTATVALKFARALAQHIIAWAKRSDLQGMLALARVVDREICAFIAIVDTLHPLVEQERGNITVAAPALNLTFKVSPALSAALDREANEALSHLTEVVQNATNWSNDTATLQAKAVVSIIKSGSRQAVLLYLTTYANLVNPVDSTLAPARRRSFRRAVLTARHYYRSVENFLTRAAPKTIVSARIIAAAKKRKPTVRALEDAYRAWYDAVNRWHKTQKAMRERAAKKREKKLKELNQKGINRVQERKKKQEHRAKARLAAEKERKKQAEAMRKVFAEQRQKDAPARAQRRREQIARKTARKVRIESDNKQRKANQLRRDRARQAGQAARERGDKDEQKWQSNEHRHKAERDQKRDKAWKNWEKQQQKLLHRHQRMFDRDLQSINLQYNKTVNSLQLQAQQAAASIASATHRLTALAQAMQSNRTRWYEKIKQQVWQQQIGRSNKLAVWAAQQVERAKRKAAKAAELKYNETYAIAYVNTTTTDENQRVAEATEAARKAAELEKDVVLKTLMAEFSTELSLRRLRNKQSAEASATYKDASAFYRTAIAKSIRLMQKDAKMQLAHAKARGAKLTARLSTERLKRRQQIAKLRTAAHAFHRRLQYRLRLHYQRYQKASAKAHEKDVKAVNRRWRKLQHERIVKKKRAAHDNAVQLRRYKEIRQNDQELNKKQAVQWEKHLNLIKRVMDHKQKQHLKVRKERREKAAQLRARRRVMRARRQKVLKEIAVKDKALGKAKEAKGKEIVKQIQERRKKKWAKYSAALKQKREEAHRRRLALKKKRQAARKAREAKEKHQDEGRHKKRVHAHRRYEIKAKEQHKVLVAKLQREQEEDLQRMKALQAKHDAMWKKFESERESDLARMKNDFKATWSQEKPKLIQRWNALLKDNAKVAGIAPAEIAALRKQQEQELQEASKRHQAAWVKILQRFRNFQFSSATSYQAQLAKLREQMNKKWQIKLAALQRQQDAAVAKAEKAGKKMVEQKSKVIAERKRKVQENLRKQAAKAAEKRNKELNRKAERKRKEARRKTEARIKSHEKSYKHRENSGKFEQKVKTEKRTKDEKKTKAELKVKEKQRKFALKGQQELAAKAKLRNIAEKKRKHERKAKNEKKVKVERRGKSEKARKVETRKKKALEVAKKRRTEQGRKQERRQKRRQEHARKQQERAKKSQVEKTRKQEFKVKQDAAAAKRRERHGKFLAKIKEFKAKREKKAKDIKRRHELRRKERKSKHEKKAKEFAAKRQKEKERVEKAPNNREGARKRETEARHKASESKAKETRRKYHQKIKEVRRKRHEVRRKHLERFRKARREVHHKRREARWKKKLQAEQARTNKMKAELKAKADLVSGAARKKLEKAAKHKARAERASKEKGRKQELKGKRQEGYQKHSQRLTEHNIKVARQRAEMNSKHAARKRHLEARSKALRRRETEFKGREKDRKAREKSMKLKIPNEKARKAALRREKAMKRNERRKKRAHHREHKAKKHREHRVKADRRRRHREHKAKKHKERQAKRERSYKRRHPPQPRLPAQYKFSVYSKKWHSYKAARARFVKAVAAYKKQMATLKGKPRREAKKHFLAVRNRFIAHYREYSKYYHSRRLAVLRYRQELRMFHRRR